jgi:hypothetical protein
MVETIVRGISSCHIFNSCTSTTNCYVFILYRSFFEFQDPKNNRLSILLVSVLMPMLTITAMHMFFRTLF